MPKIRPGSLSHMVCLQWETLIWPGLSLASRFSLEPCGLSCGWTQRKDLDISHSFCYPLFFSSVSLCYFSWLSCEGFQNSPSLNNHKQLFSDGCPGTAQTRKGNRVEELECVCVCACVGGRVVSVPYIVTRGSVNLSTVYRDSWTAGLTS